MKTDEMHRHQLLEISPTDWPVLRDMFADIWPKHILGYSIVRNFIEWHEKYNNIRNLKLYSLDGDWQSDGTFLAIVSICRLGILSSFLTSLARLKYMLFEIHPTMMMCYNSNKIRDCAHLSVH